MYVKTFKYKDFDGNQREEEHFFHLNDAEVMDWIVTDKGYTLDAVIDRLSKERDIKKIMEIVEDLILRSYGMKSPDGRRFEKDEQLSKEFKQTEAYSQLFMELIGDADKLVQFIVKIIPSDLAEKADRILANAKEKSPDEFQKYLKEQKASHGMREPKYFGDATKPVM